MPSSTAACSCCVLAPTSGTAIATQGPFLLRRTGCDWLVMEGLWRLSEAAECLGSCIVRTVELSNHPGAMLQETSQRRVATGDRAQTQFQDELAQHRRRVEDAREARDQARAQHRWWAWLRCALAMRRERRRVPRS